VFALLIVPAWASKKVKPEDFPLTAKVTGCKTQHQNEMEMIELIVDMDEQHYLLKNQYWHVFNIGDHGCYPLGDYKARLLPARKGYVDLLFKPDKSESFLIDSTGTMVPD